MRGGGWWRWVESPAVSGLRKLCFLSRYLRFQELIADLLRRPVPVRRVETLSIVAQFDVACNITHGLFASRIDCAIHELLLEGREERLGRRVVIAYAGSPERLAEPELIEQFRIVAGRIVASAVRMRDTICSEGMVLRSHLHRIGYQRGTEMAGHCPPDDFLAEAVDNGGEIDLSLPGLDLGDIADELEVGGSGGEVPPDPVGDLGDVGGLSGQRPGLADLAGHKAQVAHETADELAGGLLALADQLGVDAPVPVGLVVVVEDLPYLSFQVFLSYRGRGQRPVFPFVVAGFRHAYPQAHLREGRSISRRRGHIGGVLRCDERVLVAHCCSDAKYAATFSRKVTFCRSSRTSRSASRSRARSDS